MLSAISFGRLLPLGALDQPDHAVEEGRALSRGDAHGDPVRGYQGAAGHRRAVAAALADHGRGLAGDGPLVDRGDAVDHLAVRRDDVACLDQHDVADLEARSRHRLVLRAVGVGEQLRLRLGTRAPERIRLRLAAALRHRLGEIREQHRDPQPHDDLERETEVLAASREVAQEDHGGQGGDDLDHEHDRVLHQDPWIELGESGADRRNDDLRVGQGRYGHPLARGQRFHCSRSRLRVVRTSCALAWRNARRSARARARGRT